MTISTDHQDGKSNVFSELINSLSVETKPLEVSKSPSPRISSTTDLATTDKKEKNFSTNKSSVDKIYPHIFDEETQTGQVVGYIGSALNDAKSALDAFDDSDFQTINTRVTQIATTMSKAYPLTTFNESLGIVISYIRRAALLISVADLSRAALNTQVQALQSIFDNPMIDLDDASDIVDNLSNYGWNGEHQITSQLIPLLLGDSGINGTELEVLLQLFDD